MAKKKTERKSKTFTEAIGLNSIINDKTGFVAGLILLGVALFICVAFFSYFNTGRPTRVLSPTCAPVRSKTLAGHSRTPADRSEPCCHTDLSLAVSGFRLSSSQPSSSSAVSV